MALPRSSSSAGRAPSRPENDHGPAPNRFGHGKQSWPRAPRRHLVRAEALDDLDAALHVVAQRRAHLGDDGALVAVREQQLLAGGQRHDSSRSARRRRGDGAIAVIVRRVRILLTNDDGIDAPGLARARPSLASLARRGARRRARARRRRPGSQLLGRGCLGRRGLPPPRSPTAGTASPTPPDVDAYALDASPALCVLVGVLGGFGARPDVVLAGVNAGVNVGRSVLHSGTVGAILTGSQLGLSGLAVSMQWVERRPLRRRRRRSPSSCSTSGRRRAPRGRCSTSTSPPSAPTSSAGSAAGRISTAGIVKSGGPTRGVRTPRGRGRDPAAPRLGRAVARRRERRGARGRRRPRGRRLRLAHAAALGARGRRHGATTPCAPPSSAVSQPPVAPSAPSAVGSSRSVRSRFDDARRRLSLSRRSTASRGRPRPRRAHGPSSAAASRAGAAAPRRGAGSPPVGATPTRSRARRHRRPRGAVAASAGRTTSRCAGRARR